MEREELQVRPASGGDAGQIFQLVQETIETAYPRYYPREVVDFFLRLHSRESIQADIRAGAVIALEERGRLVGTGSSRGGHITRVYVSPAFQRRGVRRPADGLPGKKHFLQTSEDMPGRLPPGL